MTSTLVGGLVDPIYGGGSTDIPTVDHLGAKPAAVPQQS
jgi:hypothetical protein